MNCIDIDISRHHTPLSVEQEEKPRMSADRQILPIHIERSCNVSIGVILIVTPQEVWLTEDNGWSDDFEVTSSTSWAIYKEMTDAQWLNVSPTSGSGNANVNVEASAGKEGVDQEMKITFKSGSLSVEAVVKLAGRREVFNTDDGDFILADGGNFNVIKNN